MVFESILSIRLFFSPSSYALNLIASWVTVSIYFYWCSQKQTFLPNNVNLMIHLDVESDDWLHKICHGRERSEFWISWDEKQGLILFRDFKPFQIFVFTFLSSNSFLPWIKTSRLCTLVYHKSVA